MVDPLPAEVTEKLAIRGGFRGAVEGLFHYASYRFIGCNYFEVNILAVKHLN